MGFCTLHREFNSGAEGLNERITVGFSLTTDETNNIGNQLYATVMVYY
jgi:hypothetical protein